MNIALLLVAHTLCVVTFAFSVAVAGELVSIRSTELNIFIGPTLIEKSVRGRIYRLRLVPAGCSLNFRPEDVKTAGLLSTLTMTAAGWASLLLISLICLSAQTAFESIANGFSQVILGAIFPLTTGQELLAKVHEVTISQSFVAVLGMTAAKECAFNSLPLPTLSGGQLILAVWRTGFSPSEKSLITASYVGFLFTVALMIGWIIAVIHLLIGP